MTRVLTGADRLVAERFARLSGARVGLVCNQTAVESEGLVHLADLLASANDVDLVALFGPEHGVRGEAQDMVGVDAAVDSRTGLPVHSLYGHTFESLTPRPEQLEGLDVLVFDVQDVGSRYYTFQATMALCMRAARDAGVRIMVLDRPNPLGGEAVEGGTVRPGYESFVGLLPIPVRHGMTVGELARFYQGALGFDCDLDVVELDGWQRRMLWPDTGLDFVPPSPNMPTFDTALVYPGGCLVEGTELSEGRGTTRPFEQCGAPFVDPDRLVARLADLAARHPVGDVVLRPTRFLPTFHKHAGQTCGGVFVHVRDARTFRPHRFGIHLLAAVRALWPDAFRWRTRAYEFVTKHPAIDLLAGGPHLRETLDAGDEIARVLEVEDEGAARFLEARRPYLIYA